MISPALLRRVPGCEDGRLPRVIQPLAGGRGVNRVVRVETSAGRFVLRERQAPLDRPGATARHELAAQRLAAGAGLAPAVLDADASGRWLLMAHVEGAAWDAQTLQSPAGIERLGQRLAALHALALPDGWPRFDALAVAHGHLAIRPPADADEQRQCEALLAALARAQAVLEDLALPAVLNHGDLMASNLVGPRPLLVDWEYAQATDGTYDAACLLTYYPGLAASQERLLDSMGLPDRARRALEPQRARFAALNRLWARQGAHGAG